MNEKTVTNPVKAIRLKCLDCSGDSPTEVKECPIKSCALWPFRLGKNPYRTKVERELTEEQREEMRRKFRENVLNRQKATSQANMLGDE